MPDVEEAWEASMSRLTKEVIFAEVGPSSQWLALPTEDMKAAVRDAMLAAYDAGALAERRYGRWRRPYMMDEKRARIQALTEGRKE